MLLLRIRFQARVPWVRFACQLPAAACRMIPEVAARAEPRLGPQTHLGADAVRRRNIGFFVYLVDWVHVLAK